MCNSATLLDVNPMIREKAAETILALLEPGFVHNWDGSTTSIFSDALPPPGGSISTEVKMRNYWRVSSHVLITIAKTLGEIQYELVLPYSVSDGKNLLVLLENILKDRNRLLVTRVSSAKGTKATTVAQAISCSANTPERFTTIAALESAFLIFACCRDIQLNKLSLSCLGLLLEEAEIVGELRLDTRDLVDGEVNNTTPVNSVVENSGAYGDIEKILNESSVYTGLKSFQKRIRSMLRLVNKPTSGNLVAWDDIYRRWKTLCVILTTPSANFPSGEDLDSPSLSSPLRKKAKTPTKSSPAMPISGFPEDLGDWLNYTGFLCALGGVCIVSFTEDGNSPNIPSRRQSQSGGSIIGTSELSESYASSKDVMLGNPKDVKIKVGFGLESNW
jgi:hypothetical protein